MLMLTELFVGRHGWSVVSIDGPVHGDRGPIGSDGHDANHPVYRDMWQNEDAVEEMIADWSSVLDALADSPDVDVSRVGYWGLSMGTMFGLPFVSSDERVKVAVLGKAGMTGTSVIRSGIDSQFRAYAPKLSIPVMFTMQWDDERFDRVGQLELFDRIGSSDKRLQAYPGEHVDNGPDAFEAQAEFLARYIG
jgi:dienelactone hydrolase